MLSLLRAIAFICALSALCQIANADEIYNVTLDTAPLVGHSAGPFYVYLEFIDGSGIGDGNNTVTLNNVAYGGGSALGNALFFGGATGSLETGVSITDTSFINIFSEQFAPGLALSFTLRLTSNDDADGIPDGLTFFVLDNSGAPLPTLAPDGGNYFLTAALGSSGAVFNVYGSDPSQAPSVGGNPVSIDAPTVTSVSSVPEPSAIYLLGGALAMMGVRSHRVPRSATK